MKKFIIKLAAVTGIIVIIAGISALATEFSLVTLAIVFAAIITENALCGAYLGKNKHSKKYVYRKYNIYHNNNMPLLIITVIITKIPLTSKKALTPNASVGRILWMSGSSRI